MSRLESRLHLQAKKPGSGFKVPLPVPKYFALTWIRFRLVVNCYDVGLWRVGTPNYEQLWRCAASVDPRTDAARVIIAESPSCFACASKNVALSLNIWSSDADPNLHGSAL